MSQTTECSVCVQFTKFQIQLEQTNILRFTVFKNPRGNFKGITVALTSIVRQKGIKDITVSLSKVRPIGMYQI